MSTTSRRPAAQRYQQILDAATEIFHKRGYADSSIQEIADEVGILKGSLYYYMNSKEDLLYNLMMKVHDGTDEILEEVKALEGVTPLQRLRTYVHLTVTYNLDHLPGITVYYHEVDRLQPERRAKIIERRRPHELNVTEMIQQAQAMGECDPDADPRLIRNMLFGALIWVYRWYRPEGRVSREVIADACADFVMHGVVGKTNPAAARLEDDKT